MNHGFVLRGRTEPTRVGKIIALGRNYRAHAREMGSSGDEPPLLFLKPASALVGDGGQVIRPPHSLSLQPEVELVVAIGRRGRRITAAEAAAHVLGYAVGLDMTLRDVQSEAKRRGHPWAVAKGFDTAAPLSAVAPAAEVGDARELTVELRVNGDLRQRGVAADMILSIPEIIAFVSRIFTLESGDLIFTGTPEGVADVFPGDALHASLLEQAELRVTVVAEEEETL
jgi:2-keto-4-pentenoate hydratase/2-oxohepta-3-ene-1,7-dioic acid hydratase in catechol pathway